MTELDYTTEEPRGKRPAFLLVLCILTFITTGIEFLLNLLKLASGPFTQGEMRKQMVQFATEVENARQAGASGIAEFMETYMRLFKQTNDNHYLAVGISMVVCVVGAYAAFRMLRGEKVGFHFYIIYSILSIVSIYAYASIGNVPTIYIIFGVVLSLIFILLYSRNLKWMR